MTPRARLLSALQEADGPATLGWLARTADVSTKAAIAILSVLQMEGRAWHSTEGWHA